MASNIEAEMARFEEEISSVNEGSPDDLNPPPLPPIMPPPPMFIPHALQASNKQERGEMTKSNISFAGSNDPEQSNSSSKHESGPFINSTQMIGPPPRRHVPTLSRPMRPGFPGPEPMRPNMMSHSMNFGPMGPRPLGSGPIGPNSMPPNMLGPHSMPPCHLGPGPGISGPMGMRPMSTGPIGLNGPNMDNMGPMPPPMPSFFPPPLMPDFGKMTKQQQSVYAAAPILNKRIEENETKGTSKTKKTTDKEISRESEKSASEISKTLSSLSKNDDRLSEIGPEAGPHVGPPKVPPMPVIMAQTTFGGQPALYGLSPLAGNPQMAKSATQAQKKKKIIRTAAGQKWEDPSLLDWDPNDYRIFCGDLGNEVTDDTLARIFSRYSSFQKARVVREKNSKKSKGYGFVSFKDPTDFIRAMREINGKYVGNRPIKLRKSNWKDRNVDIVRKKVKEKKKLGYKV